MSNAALTHFINPAVGGQTDQIQFRSNLGTTNPYTTDFDASGYEPGLTNFGLSFTQQRYWVSLAVESVSYSWYEEGTSRFRNFRLQSGYQLSRTLAVGLGAGVNSWSMPRSGGDIGNSLPAQDNANMFFDAGVYYADSYSIGRIIIQPEAGVSLNHIGTYDTFEMGGMDAYLSQAGQLRWSAGIGAVTSEQWRGRSWFGANVYSGWNKYFSRRTNPYDDNGNGNGFSDLFNNWGLFETIWSYPTETVSAGDQVSLGLGAEVSVLETLSLRYGSLSGADLWVRARQSWGVGVDLKYVAFNITTLNYQSDARWDDSSRLIFYEVQLNLPVSLISSLY